MRYDAITNELRIALSLAPIGVPAHAAEFAGRARIRVNGEYFEPCEDGFEANILPLIEDEWTCDLLAYDPKRPDRWWLRLGVGWALGADNAHERLPGEPLAVFRTPASWLAAGGTGVCVLDWTAPAASELLDADLHAEDVALGAKLDRHLSIQIRPRVFVPGRVAA